MYIFQFSNFSFFLKSFFNFSILDISKMSRFQICEKVSILKNKKIIRACSSKTKKTLKKYGAILWSRFFSCFSNNF